MRRSSLVIAAAIGCAAVIALPAASASAATSRSAAASVSAAASKAHGHKVLWMHRAVRTVVDAAPTGTSLGDLVVTRGTLSHSQAGESIGTYHYAATTIAVLPEVNEEHREVFVDLKFGDGSIIVSGMNEAAIGGAPTTPAAMAIVGGTGAYFGAGGTLVITPLGGPEFKLDLRFAG